MSKNSNSTFGSISFGNTLKNVNYGNENGNSFGSSSRLNSSGSSSRLNSSGFSVSSSNAGSSSIFRSPSTFGTPFRPSESSAFSPVSPVRSSRYQRTPNNSGSRMNRRPVFDPFYTPIGSPSDLSSDSSQETESSNNFTETTIPTLFTANTEPPTSTESNETGAPSFQNMPLPPHYIPNEHLNNILYAIANSTMGPQNPPNQPIIPLNYGESNKSRPSSTSSELSTSSNLNDSSMTGGFISYKRFLGK